MQLMEHDLQILETVIVYNFITTLSNYVWHLQRLSEILEHFIVSSVAKDCVVLSQYGIFLLCTFHYGTFLLVTTLDMSSYKSTTIQCKSTSLWWGAVLSKKIPTLSPRVENVFVNKSVGHVLRQDWWLSLQVATSPKLWAVFCPFHLCT